MDTPSNNAGAAPPAPLLWPALGLVAGIACSERLAWQASGTLSVALLVISAGCGVLLLAHERGRDGRWLTRGLLVVIAACTGMQRYQAATAVPADHVRRLLGPTPVLTRVAGRIVTTPIERPGVLHNPFLPFNAPDRTQFVLELDELHTVEPHTRLTGRIRVNIEATDLELARGMRVRLTGRLFLPRGPRNPGETDWARWHRQQGLAAGMHVEGSAHVAPLSDELPWHAQLIGAAGLHARSLLLEPLADVHVGTDEAAWQLLDVMVLGHRSAADRALNDAFLRVGGLHFLAVSGFHVGVLAAFAWALGRGVLRLRRQAAAVLMLAAVIWYALVAEPNAPVLRAATMVACGALATVLNRPVSVFNWMSLAAIVILLANPLELGRAGFQLTFVLVLALLTIVPILQRALAAARDDAAPPPEANTLAGLAGLKLRRWSINLVLVCATAYVVSLPLTLLHFGRFAPYGMPATVVLSPLIVATIVLSFITLLGTAIFPPAGTLLGVAMKSVTTALLRAVGLFEHVPHAVIQCRPPAAWLVGLTYAAILLFILRRSPGRTAEPDARLRRTQAPIVRGRTLATTGIVAVLVLSWLAWLVTGGEQQPAGVNVHVLAVASGSCVLVTCGDDAVVYDVGTPTNTDTGEIAALALRWLGHRDIDNVLISHGNFDHYAGLPTLMRLMPVRAWHANMYSRRTGEVHDAYRRLASRLPAGAPPPAPLAAGDELRIGDLRFEVCWPPPNLESTSRENDRSIVARLHYRGRRVLLAGDIEAAALSALLEHERRGEVDLRADVLIAPHHGAVLKDLTADFYAAVSPSVVIVSAADARAPLPAAVDAAVGPARILTTGEVGAVRVHIDPRGGMSVQTPYSLASPPR